jgi:chromate transport protein ChrA
VSNLFRGAYQAVIAIAYAIFNFLNRQMWRRLINEDSTVMTVSIIFSFVVCRPADISPAAALSLAVVAIGLLSTNSNHKTWEYTIQTDETINNALSDARIDPALNPLLAQALSTYG